MTVNPTASAVPPPPPAAPARDVIEAAIAAACARIAPLWPLKHFVAVNPFLGFADRSFAATSALMHRVVRVDMLMPRAFYAAERAAGAFGDVELAEALAARSPEWCEPDLAERPAAVRTKHAAHVATVAEILDSLAGGDRRFSGTSFMVDEISRWCAAYFDEGQSAWRLPTRGRALFAAWRSSMHDDRNPEAMGIHGFRAIVQSLPADPVDAIVAVVERQGVPARAVEEYLYQALLDIGGWAAYARYLGWQAELHGGTDPTLRDLLAVRIVWGFTLFVQRIDDAFISAWRRAMNEAALMPLDDRLGDDATLVGDLVLHDAYERGYLRRLVRTLDDARAARASIVAPPRPELQAAFCIDVRSEVIRRKLEEQSEAYATLGFAGFFGYPIEYVPIGHVGGNAQCPVLLAPAFTVRETVAGASAEEEQRILDLRLLRRRIAKVWKSFKIAAVSSFVFVETMGLTYLWKITSDSLGVTRTVTDPDADGLDPDVIARLAPEIDAHEVDGRTVGFTDDARVGTAENALRGMSLTSNFAPLVLMVGHGSTTVNNPHASGLDCGACGGHTGEANARVAAFVLNDPRVRRGLAAKGITIPDDTWFVGAQHDTTTDDVRIYDEALVPETHRERLANAKAALAQASSASRRERAALLGLPADAKGEAQVRARSRDWAQTRPEWGLARNAAFIAAPRSLSRGAKLDSRVFLHDYDWRLDTNFAVLELIMTAPLVVASWINLQYYASTVNNRVFGSGNKVLHNVVGTIGVLEGNAGDLRVGLPLQSVHDGQRFVHEPIRLHAIIAAPTDAIDGILAKHAGVRDLVEHNWVHLFAMADDGRVTHRYTGEGRWTPLAELVR